MRRQLRAELLKARTSRTTLTLLLSAVALIAVIVALHLISPAAADLAERERQLQVRGIGTTFGMLFAALLGAMSITGEIRHGLIRPTLLATPRRGRVIAAKMAVAALAGAGLGLLAVATAVGVTTAGLGARDIPIATTGDDLAQLLAGGTAAGAAWAGIGVGIGALVRSQVATLVGLAVWLLFLENVVISSLAAAGKFAPGASAAALAGASVSQTATYLLAPALGALMVAGYLAAATAAGMLATARRDFG